MKGIILAAGRGSRMKAMTMDKPKCLVLLNGKSLLARQIGAFRKAGITEIAIVTGYRRELLEQYSDKEFHNPYWDKTNMVESLRCASEWLQESPCVVSYSDIVFEPAAITSLIGSPSDISITYDPSWLDLWGLRFEDPLTDAETFKLGAQGQLREIGGSASTTSEIDGQYMGLLKFTPVGWKHFDLVFSKLSRKARATVHMTDMLQKIIDSGLMQVGAVRYKGLWSEIDSETDLAVAERIYSSG